MTYPRRYRVALSYPGEERGLVAQVAEWLSGTLGRDKVFYDRYYEAELARPDLDTYLQQIYHDGSDLDVVFLSRDYARKEWCGLEWRAVRDLIMHRRAEQIMLVRLDDASLPGLFPIDGTLDARGRSPEELANLILERLTSLGIGSTAAHPVTRPGLFRLLLDRVLPRLHHFLTRHGTLSEPPELPHLDAYLRELKARIQNDIREKIYLPLDATVVPRRSTVEESSQDPFERPIQQVIRQVLGRAQGGDSATAQIAAVNRRSRLVRNILKALLKTEDPLVLLGDPGSGKTMTLMEAALALADSEIGRVFPVVTVYVRLGEFHVGGEVGPEDVREYVKRSAPERIRPWMDELDAAGRLILLFDGMDEMSRDRYTEHTEALSLFAGTLQGRTKTLFSCRITDFSPAFLHHRLVLLPFSNGQIAKYLHKYLSVPTLEIEGKRFSIRELARRLAAGDLPIDASNPFVLWLLCLYLEERKTWPESRVALIDYYNEKNYARKREDARKEGILLPDSQEAFQAWSHFAFTITERNRGSAIPVEVLSKETDTPRRAERLQLMIRTGKLCGVLTESTDGREHLVRFEHHRFQEYFTALYIHRINQNIAWLDRLGAPRWQETLLNLVLLGGGEEAVAALVEAIAGPIARLRFEEHEDESAEPKPPKIPAEEETVLADRVELGANLLRQAERSSPAVERLLSPCLREAVDFLVERGNPITQVKMMRSCQRLNDLDLLKTLEKPLRSPVQWVRNQALILVAATSAGVRTSRSNIATEMGYDLATNSLLPRWPTYVKALSTMGGARLWWSFLLAILLALANFALLLTGAGAFFRGSLVIIRHLSSSLPPWVGSFALPMLERPETASAFALLILGIAVLAMKSKPSFAWAWVLGSSLGTIALGLIGLGLWRAEENALKGIVIGILLWPLAVSLVVTIGLAAQASVLLVYLVLTKRARSAGHPTAGFLALAWENCGFAGAFRRALEYGSSAESVGENRVFATSCS